MSSRFIFRWVSVLIVSLLAVATAGCQTTGSSNRNTAATGASANPGGGGGGGGGGY